MGSEPENLEEDQLSQLSPELGLVALGTVRLISLRDPSWGLGPLL